MIYLRVIDMGIKWENPSIDIFEGNIKKDKEYWLESMSAVSVKYFKLIEIKV